MSQLPVTALLKAIPASRQTAGQTINWQADVPPDYLRVPTPPELRQDIQDELNARKPWLKNPAMLDGIVPESERHGNNEDGIPRKLAWLAKNGYTVVSICYLIHSQLSFLPCVFQTSIPITRFSRQRHSHSKHPAKNAANYSPRKNASNA